MYVLMIGNTNGGYEEGGWYDTEEEAIAAAEDDYRHEDWYVQHILPLSI